MLIQEVDRSAVVAAVLCERLQACLHTCSAAGLQASGEAEAIGAAGMVDGL